jgi:hypothetical protein
MIDMGKIKAGKWQYADRGQVRNEIFVWLQVSVSLFYRHLPEFTD